MYYIGIVTWGTSPEYTQDYHVIEASNREEAVGLLLEGFDFTVTNRPDKVDVLAAQSGFPVIFVTSQHHESPAAALGSVTSEAKAAASRRNGRKGGRPRKPTA